MKKIIKNKEELAYLAASIAASLVGGDILALEGDLGSGKTTFTQNLASALGVSKTVTSPTFNIMKKYEIRGSGLWLVHMDCYRLMSEDDAISIGIDEYLGQKNIITVIEWPEKIVELLPPEKTKTIKFRYIDENTREIES